MSIAYAILVIMKKLFLLVSIIWSLVSAPKAYAASEFTTSFTSLYTISQSGSTSVTHTITLKNNLAHIYATNYSIATSGDQLTNIQTGDEFGPISHTTTTQNNITTIHLAIDRPAIGKDQKKTLTLSYQTTDVVESLGDTLTLNIPRLSRANEAGEYTRVVKIEGVRDRSQFIYPPPSKIEPDGDFTLYTFSGHHLDSLTLLFGSSVTYKLNLIYELKNKQLSEIETELAIPPDTAYQHILLDSIDPRPVSIHLDTSGNWLAKYRLKSQEKLIVKTELYATVYPQPILFDPSSTSFQKTTNSKYWDTNSRPILDLANQLQTTKNIYDYLTSNFTYNYAGIKSGAKRLGALASLTSPTSVLCTEFTDSFISLARALNISSREINGYGYTKNITLQPQNVSSDILHAWPEYYDPDKKTWISVDPTWGNTTGGIDYFNKLDFSHIAFVRHGEEDNYPLPAGAYKSNPSDKHVLVEIASAIPPDIIQTETKNNRLYNTGNVAIRDEILGYLPPYGSAQLVTSPKLSFYAKIKLLCAKLLSKFWRRQPVSTSLSTF